MGSLREWVKKLTATQPPGGIGEPRDPDPENPRPEGELGRWALVAMGIGATIGAGIFVTAGQVARDHAGPGVILSFVVAGLACAMAGLCYAEFAAMSPNGGSAYTYAYATMGELLAWIIGWDLILEYAFAGSIVAVEWALNLVALLGAVGVTVPPWLYQPVNFLAVMIIGLVTAVLVRGVRESARVNAVMVVVKVGVVLLVIVFGAWFVNTFNWFGIAGPKLCVGEWFWGSFKWLGIPEPNPAPSHPFLPFGLAGVMTGAGIVFFSYIGFDAVSTHAEETAEPRGQNLAFGILGSLVICTLLYIGVAVVLVGMVPWPAMAATAPVVNAFVMQGGWFANSAGIVIGIGAIAGMTSVLLVTFSGQARIFRAMSRDGLLPRRVFAVQHRRYRTPHRSLILTGCVAALIAGVTPAEKLLEMVAIGTLLAFAIVCAAVLIMRQTNPELHRPFRLRGVYVIAPLGIIVNLAMMFSLDIEAWLRLGVWLVIGLVVYFGYGHWYSVIRQPRRRLIEVEGSFAVCRLPPGSPSPAGAGGGGVISVTRTGDEVSIVCLEAVVPDGATCERGWRCLRVEGPMPLDTVGVLASLTAPLAWAEISVFAVSTFDTDYLFVRAADFDRAVAALRGEGHSVALTFTEPLPQPPQTAPDALT